MKRLLLIALVLVITLSGCSLSQSLLSESEISQHSSSSGGQAQNVLLTETDSVVKFGIYPDMLEYTEIGPFERWQFSGLSPLQKSIYIKLDNAIFNMQTGFVDVGECEYRDLELAYCALRYDRPEYFWLPTAYTVKTSGKHRKVQFAEKELDWYCSKDERSRAEAQIKEVLSEFLRETEPNLSDYELELKLHEWLCDRVSYDSGALNDDRANWKAWTVLGAIIDGKAVCEGYSKSIQLMCNMLGIQSTVITGTTTGAHMWNQVKIDGEWYHLDITANDSSDKGSHAFFNVTDDCILKSRTIDALAQEQSDEELKSGKYIIGRPRCNSTRNNFFVKNSVYITNMNQLESTVISAVCSAVKDGKKMVEIGFSSSSGFVYGRNNTQYNERFELYISAANLELEQNQRISTFSIGGIDGALSIILSWN